MDLRLIIVLKTNLIAIGGFKGVGKDTSADMLRYLLNSPKMLHNYTCYKVLHKLFLHKWVKTSFAHPLKRTLAAMLNMKVEWFENRKFKEELYIRFSDMHITYNPNPDLILKDNQFNRCLNKNDFNTIKDSYITMRQLMQRWGTSTMRAQYGDKIWILLTLINDKPTIISDLRFKVEAEEIRKRGGMLFYVDRIGYCGGQHASEREVNDLVNNNKFDSVICNYGTLTDLFNVIKRVILPTIK